MKLQHVSCVMIKMELIFNEMAGTCILKVVKDSPLIVTEVGLTIERHCS